MPDTRIPRHDAPEGEPFIAGLVLWAKATGGIQSVTATVHMPDGGAVTQTVDFDFDPNEDD